jgi:hypothetical protein
MTMTIIKKIARISTICCDIRGNKTRTSCSGLETLSSDDKDEPNIYKNPMTKRTAPSIIVIKKLSAKATLILKFFLYVSYPLLIIFPVSSTIIGSLLCNLIYLFIY